MRFLYTPEMDDFIRDHREGIDLNDMTALFNEHFGASVTISAMRAKYKNLGIRVGARRAVYTDTWPREVVEFFRAHNIGPWLK